MAILHLLFSTKKTPYCQQFKKKIKIQKVKSSRLDYTLEISKNNFVFQSSSIWNKLIVNILQRNLQSENGIVVRGSSQNSDLCATLPFVKKKLKTILFNQQSVHRLSIHNFVSINFT